MNYGFKEPRPDEFTRLFLTWRRWFFNTLAAQVNLETSSLSELRGSLKIRKLEN
jgi:hypothetical protein